MQGCINGGKYVGLWLAGTTGKKWWALGFGRSLRDCRELKVAEEPKGTQSGNSLGNVLRYIVTVNCCHLS